MSQSRGERDCSGHSASITNDLRMIHSPNGQHLAVFQRWVEDRARALGNGIVFFPGWQN